MDSQRGLSFIEVLIALILMSTNTLLLANWQLMFEKKFIKTINQTKDLNALENQYEGC